MQGCKMAGQTHGFTLGDKQVCRHVFAGRTPSAVPEDSSAKAASPQANLEEGHDTAADPKTPALAVGEAEKEASSSHATSFRRRRKGKSCSEPLAHICSWGDIL